jgi:Asp-tRNA(Asn)/Glu-tRNA(Gln) amidotransferase A subunit family amidase
MSIASSFDRRAFLGYFSSIGLGSTLLPGVLWAQAQQGPEITKEMIASAEELAGLKFSDEERTAIARGLQQTRNSINALHQVPIDMSVPPALVFEPVPPGEKLPAKTKAPTVRSRVPVMARPGSVDELAYSPVTQLSELVRTRKVKPTELTEMYLSRLKRYDPQLHCVITLTEERARAQAKAADSEIALGKYRGPLHGIPWGAKDLLAVKGYPTTWGAGLYKDQTFDYDATVVKRLDNAGAILVAKLTLGALAQGDRWYAERTRNPWNPETGSSGSSAGPASATASGCVAFAIGSETQGSITSPSRTCGIAGFRPTFGRVPRTGAMALSWTMDKLGPMCRSAEDCALVFDVIQGPDGFDYSVKNYPFNWNAGVKPPQLRIAYVKAAFERRGQDGTVTPNPEAMNFLKVMQSLGAKLTEIETPTPAYTFISPLTLNAECGAAFEGDTLNGKIKELESYSTWPNTFRTAQFIPAVDYVNAGRARTLLCKQWWDLFKNIDVILTPQEPLNITNITGTPSIVVPTGFAIPQPGRGGRGGPPLASAAGAPAGRGDSGRAGGAGRGGDTTRPAAPPVPTVPLPTSMFIMGPIYRDENILAVAHAFQNATDFHLKRPPSFA